MNKGLEVIEASLLFGIDYADISVTVHPQSVIHSMVEFVDGSTMAQASPPDMKLPIALGLDWPHRVAHVAEAVDWSTAHTWTFEPLDELAFPAVALAKSVGSAGLTFPAVMNAANEEAVLAFHAGRLGFTDIVDTVSRVVEAHSAPEGELSREVLFDADAWARAHAREVIATT
jgi:1-deoxy-D-xylulose-5-phosphate reductoisomerase